MAKILCNCGNIIFDITDNIPHKAHFIANQDVEKYRDEIEYKKFEEISTISANYFQQIFQCNACNAILFFKKGNNKAIVFNPVDKTASSNLLNGIINLK